MGPVEVQSLDTMRQILEVNLLGTISTIQAFLPGMKAQSQGRILVTGSIGGLQGERGQCCVWLNVVHNMRKTNPNCQSYLFGAKGLPFNEVYCASKFAVEGMCESLAILLQHFNIQ